MPNRLPKKGDVIYAHLEDGDFVGVVTWEDVDDPFIIHWLLRPGQKNSEWSRAKMLKDVSEYKIKVLEQNFNANIDAPRYSVGDLIVAESANGKIVGYILRATIKGHEITLPDRTKHHNQFFYHVSVPKQSIREVDAMGHVLEYETKGTISEVPEILIDYGLHQGTVTIHRRAKDRDRRTKN